MSNIAVSASACYGGDMVIYEVNIQIDPAIPTHFPQWLKKHVEEILKLPGFVSADIFNLDTSESSGSRTMVIHYRVESAAALESYFKNHASRLRQEAIDLFGQSLSLNRRILLFQESIS